MQKTIVIWGAGRIGRGFVADLFAPAGYRLVLVDQSAALVAQLRELGRYTVVWASEGQAPQHRVISAFTALPTTDTAAVAQAIAAADLVAVAVFPRDLATVAQQLAPGLVQRFRSHPDAPLDIILCTNLAHAGPQLELPLLASLPLELRPWAETHVGIVESLVIRMVVEPPAEALARDPLVVWTNGYASLPVDRKAFRGPLPEVPGLRLVDDMRAEELRKLYTYNTFHAALAYFGALLGCTTIVECFTDPEVCAAADGALRESSQVLQAALGFDSADMEHWLAAVRAQTNNPALGDTVQRYGADPRRKLRRKDRLLGPLLLARDHHISAPYLTRAVAAALLYDDPGDPGVAAIQQQIGEQGLDLAVRELCELGAAEGDVVDAIHAAYDLLVGEAIVRRASQLAFDYERRYHGCGQCTLAAILDSLEGVAPCAADAVFEAATGLAGGLGLAGDAPCGALMGASLAFGLLYPRHRDHFAGDRENKYRSYAMVQQLRERYIETYGGTTCWDVHRRIFGRSFDLRDPVEREAFAAAGAHEDKCTAVVATAVRWAMEIILEQRRLDQQRQ